MDRTSGLLLLSPMVKTASGRPMRSILPERRRSGASAAAYSANLMLDEPPLIARTHALAAFMVDRSYVTVSISRPPRFNWVEDLEPPSATASGSGLNIFFRFLFEPHCAGIRAKVVGLSLIRSCPCRLLLIYIHPANRILCHFRHPLFEISPPTENSIPFITPQPFHH